MGVREEGFGGRGFGGFGECVRKKGFGGDVARGGFDCAGGRQGEGEEQGEADGESSVEGDVYRGARVDMEILDDDDEDG